MQSTSNTMHNRGCRRHHYAKASVGRLQGLTVAESRTPRGNAQGRVQEEVDRIGLHCGRILRNSLRKTERRKRNSTHRYNKDEKMPGYIW